MDNKERWWYNCSFCSYAKLLFSFLAATWSGMT